MFFKNVKINEITKKVNLGEYLVNVKQYIPTNEKIKIIEALVESCIESGFVNRIKLDAFFSVFLVLNYTDIEIENEKRDEDSLMEIYDFLESNGFVQFIINAIPKEEIKFLEDSLEKTINDLMVFRCSTAGAIENLVLNLPKTMEELQKVLKDFDFNSLSIMKEIKSQYDY